MQMEAFYTPGVQALLNAGEVDVDGLMDAAEQGAGVVSVNGWDIEVQQHDGFVTLDIPGEA